MCNKTLHCPNMYASSWYFAGHGWDRAWYHGLARAIRFILPPAPFYKRLPDMKHASIKNPPGSSSTGIFKKLSCTITLLTKLSKMPWFSLPCPPPLSFSISAATFEPIRELICSEGRSQSQTVRSWHPAPPVCTHLLFGLFIFKVNHGVLQSARKEERDRVMKCT